MSVIVLKSVTTSFIKCYVDAYGALFPNEWATLQGDKPPNL